MDHPNLYPRIVRAMAETPWALRPETLAVLLDLVAFRAAGGTLTDTEIEERIGAGPATRRPAMAGTVAVIPLYGVIQPRASMMSRTSGGTSLREFTSALRAAAGSPQVGQILLDVDSPGGSVDLVPETAQEIRDARARKPVVAVANTDAASAAYWLAAQADELVVTPSGSVGSIGVFAAHEDRSRFEDTRGYTTTLISAGKYKVEGNPFEPLTQEARDAIQARVDDYYGMFVADVARGRATTVAAVREGFGEGRMVGARHAVKAGMADRVDTFDATLARMVRGARAAQQAPAADSVLPPAEQANGAEWLAGDQERDLAAQLDEIRNEIINDRGDDTDG